MIALLSPSRFGSFGAGGIAGVMQLRRDGAQQILFAIGAAAAIAVFSLAGSVAFTAPAFAQSKAKPSPKTGGGVPAAGTVADPSAEDDADMWGDPNSPGSAPAADDQGDLDEPDQPIGTADPAAGGTAGPTDSGDQPMDLGAGADQPMDLGGDQPMDLGPAAKSAPAATGGGLGTFELAAKLTADGEPITTGMTWRVFSSEPGPDGKLKTIGVMNGGHVNLKLRPGVYFVHAAYGRAGVTRKITVTDTVAGDTVILNAGGLRLSALVGKDQALDAGQVSFDIYAPDQDGSDERMLLVPNAPPGHIIGLNAGTYHIVCRYGDANAVVRADMKVEAGKLTEATVYQKAARMTLKLVSDHGGEAMANTAWSVVTPSGESVADSVGAFPAVVLAVGDYTAIAKHDGKIFERNFTVEAGLDRDVEVIAKQ